jgi:hypothetical protein
VNLAGLRVTKVRRFHEPRTADFGKSRFASVEFVVLIRSDACIKRVFRVLEVVTLVLTSDSGG